jgi:hypothetical protein
MNKSKIASQPGSVKSKISKKQPKTRKAKSKPPTKRPRAPKVKKRIPKLALIVEEPSPQPSNLN